MRRGKPSLKVLQRLSEIRMLPQNCSPEVIRVSFRPVLSVTLIDAGVEGAIVHSLCG